MTARKPAPTELDDPAGWSCPLPLRQFDRVVMGHGGGGQLSSDLVRHLIMPSLGADPEAELLDAAVVPLGEAGRLAFSTDSFVVRPLFFPGGCIGDLAVNGTVNDISMSGAVPVALSCSFVIEEGLPLATLARIVEAVGQAARNAGVEVVTGDTKVVERGKADGIYVNTAGIGVIPAGVDLRPSLARPGDAVLVSGPIGEHGIAVLSQREGLDFGTTVTTDSAPLNDMVASMLAASSEIRVLRDPTRGGVAASLCEIAESAGLGIEYDERLVPVPDPVAAACAFLGLDPTHIANEGKLIAIVSEAAVDAVLDAMHEHPVGRTAVRIGTVVSEHPGVVGARTKLGALRVVSPPLGEHLPRIC